MGLWKGFSTSLREYFDEANTYEHAHNALDTLCDSKLHHHGNHYQEKKVIKKRWGRQKHRCTARMSEREGEVEEGREGFMPRAQKYTNSELWSKNLIPPQPHIETLTQKKLKKAQMKLKKSYWNNWRLLYHILNITPSFFKFNFQFELENTNIYKIQ